MKAWRFRSPGGQDRGLELGLGPGAAYVPDGRRVGPARGRRGGRARGLSRRGSRPRRFLPQSSRCSVQWPTWTPHRHIQAPVLHLQPHHRLASPAVSPSYSKWHRRPPSGSDQKPGVILDSPLSHLPHRPDQRKSCPVFTISKRLSCFFPHHLSGLLPRLFPDRGRAPWSSP